MKSVVRERLTKTSKSGRGSSATFSLLLRCFDIPVMASIEAVQLRERRKKSRGSTCYDAASSDTSRISFRPSVVTR